MTTETKPNDDAQSTTTLPRRENNEEIRIYDDRTIEHHYDGFPAQGVVRYDVTDFEIVDIESERDDTSMETLDHFRGEARDAIEETLFGGGRRHHSATAIDSSTIRVDGPEATYEVRLDKENEERIA